MTGDAERSAAAAELDEIDRIHDDLPALAAQRLRRLDAAALPAGRLGAFAFLLNHVLGEKLGAWREAAQRVGALAGRADAPLPVLRHWAAAALLAGDDELAARAQAHLAASAQVDAPVAAALARLGAWNFAVDANRDADRFAVLARSSLGFAPSALDAGFAAAFNNVTVALLGQLAGRPLGAAQREVLMLGAEAARAFWLRAGDWLEDERSDYLCAKVALRIGDAVAAATAAQRALAVVAAHGDDAVERAFLLQPLARIFHEVAPVCVSCVSVNRHCRHAGDCSSCTAGATRACAAPAGAGLASSAREGHLAFDCAPLGQSASRMHPRNSRVPREISGLAAAFAALGERAQAAALRTEVAALAANLDADTRRLLEQDAAELFALEPS